MSLHGYESGSRSRIGGLRIARGASQDYPVLMDPFSHGRVISGVSAIALSVSGPDSGVATGIGRSAIWRKPSIARRKATERLLSGSKTNRTSDRPVIS